MKAAGYILVETIVAMGILSITSVVLHDAVQQAIIARGQSMDYTEARFLLEQQLAQIELQPELVEAKKDGQFDPPHQRFSYAWEIKKVTVPKPILPGQLSPEQRQMLNTMFKGYLGKVTITIKWNRAGQPFTITGETLLKPEQLWIPNSGAGQ